MWNTHLSLLVRTVARVVRHIPFLLAVVSSAKTRNNHLPPSPGIGFLGNPRLPPLLLLLPTLHNSHRLSPRMSRIFRQDAKWSPNPPTTWNSDDKWPAPSLLSHLIRTIRRKLAFWDPADRASISRHSRSSSLSPVPSPATLKFILQCCIWYASSAMSSNTGKSIMNRFRYPVTLTFVQFFFVASFCALFMSPLVRFSKLRPPTRAIFNATLPMGAFQVGGHIFSSMAISRIPVSTVHTIKVSNRSHLPFPLFS